MSGWATRPWQCPHCGWEGVGDEALVIQSAHAQDAWCPACWKADRRQHLGYEHDPTLEQAEASNDPSLRSRTTEHRAFLANIERTWLKHPDQLPDLPDDRLTFTWDTDERADPIMTTISYGDRVVWSEQAVYGGWQRFDGVRSMLAARYGDRFAGLEPAHTQSAIAWLDGD